MPVLLPFTTITTTTIMTELPSFLINAFLGGALLVLLTGSLGCLLVWRRMAFFGDALAHAALLGVALALWLQLPMTLAVMGIGTLFALLLLALQRSDLANDTLLAILSPTALSLGLIAISLVPGVRVDLTGYLFGDILAITQQQVWLMAAGITGALLILAASWKKLLAVMAAPDLARVEGYPVARLELTLLLLTALAIAAGVQIVGVLLITALLVIPAATARRFATTPLQMALLSSAMGLVAVTLGLAGSYIWDIPSSPAIVVASALLFTASRLRA